MKTKKVLLISISTILILILLVAGVSYYKETKTLDYKIKKLDKKYHNLDEFKLNAPFDINAIDDYRIVSLSSQSHTGIDFFAEDDVLSIPFLAMIDGVVKLIDPHIMYNQDGGDNWAYSFIIAVNSKYSINLNFETFGSSDQIKQMQEANIFVKEGDYIKQGELIANLIIGGRHAHVHYSLMLENSGSNESFVIPEPYFTEEAMALINSRLVG